MQTQEIMIPSQGRSVDCTVYWPDQRIPSPAVVLGHGYNGSKNGSARLAAHLAQQGVIAVCMTFCGGSTRDPSGFGTTNMTLLTQRDDMLSVVAWLESTGLANSIFLYGESMGGITAVLASVAAPDKIAGMGLLYPALCIPDNWRERIGERSAIPETLSFWDMTLGHGFFDAIWDMDIFSMLPAYTGPVLMMQGDQDPVVPVKVIQQAAELYENARLVVFPGEKHGFTPDAYSRVCEMVSQLVLKNS